MMQEWAQTVHNLMISFEDTMKVLGLSDHALREGKDPRTSEPEQDKRDVTGLPGRQATDQTHDSEALSNLRAQFQNVSCHLHESHACPYESHACCCRGSQGLVHSTGAVSPGALPLASNKVVRCTAAALRPDAACVSGVASRLHASTGLQLSKAGTTQCAAGSPRQCSDLQPLLFCLLM